MADQTFPLYPHLHQNRVSIAVRRDGDYLQPIARGLALGPKLVAGAAEKSNVPGPQRLLKRVPIHKTQHQDLAAGRILHDGGKQPLHLVEINLLVHAVMVHTFFKFVARNKKPAVANRVSGLNLCD